MIHVTEIAFTGYPVSNLPRARAFYEGVLGLKTGSVWAEGEKGWIEYDIGPSTLAISNFSQDTWKPSPDGPGVALEVDDFGAAVDHLRAAGVTFRLEPTDSPVCRMAIVSDPDGNALVIHHRTTKSG